MNELFFILIILNNLIKFVYWKWYFCDWKWYFSSLLRLFLCGVSCFRSKVGPGQTLRVSVRANIALCLNCTPSARRPSVCPSTRLNILSSADPIINQWGNAALMSEPHEHNIQEKKIPCTNRAFKEMLKTSRHQGLTRLHDLVALAGGCLYFIYTVFHSQTLFW